MKNFDISAFVKATAKNEDDLKYIIEVCNLMKHSSLYEPAMNFICSIEKEARRQSGNFYVLKNIDSKVVYDFNIIPNIDIIATEKCNLNCATCGHLAPIVDKDSPDYFKAEDLAATISKLKELDRVLDSILITGGEPMLNPDLPEIVDIVYKNFPDKQRYLYSNLTLYEKNREWLLKKMNETGTSLIGSMYPGHNDDGMGQAMSDRDEGLIDFKIGGGFPPNFGDFPISREPKYNNRTKGGCYNSRCIALKGNYIYLCPVVSAIPHANKFFNMSLEDSDFNRICLDDIEVPEELLVRILLPMPFCKHCNPYRGNLIGWKLSERKESEWFEVESEE